jgi:hypothetical protein
MTSTFCYVTALLLFLPQSADPLKLCQVGWGASLQSYCQVSPEMLDWVQVQAMAGPLNDIETCPEVLRCLGCMLRVVVLLEGEPSPKSEVLSRLSRISLYFARFIFPSIPTRFQSQPLKNIPTACYTVWCQVSSRCDTWHLGQRVNWFQVRLGKLPAGCNLPFTEWILSGHSAIKDWLECCRDGCPSPQRSSVSVHRVLGHLPDQWPSPPIVQFGQGASSMKNLGGSRLPVREVVLLGTIKVGNLPHSCASILWAQTIPTSWLV